ncbi:MAG: purine-nucleoside phosphorylase [Saprospiraceae bacterium]|nr:purine-nucleoside phosphorylase [Saprospiraceae bacterium]
MPSLYEKIEESAHYLSDRIPLVAKTAVVLGTGLGDFVDSISNKIEIAYDDIPYFVVSTVQSHSGKFIFGYKSGVPIIVMAGRLHYYEGYSTAEITFPIRVLKALGVENIIMTNASGGINAHFTEGDIVIVTDHINLMPDNPLRGKNDERLGPRFPDMLHAYDESLIKKFHSIGEKINIKLQYGVYLGLQGPSLETPAEYRMAHILGADLVGMSTIPEVIVAKHSGMKVCVFSIVSNVCFPKSALTETTLEEVIMVVNRSSGKLMEILDHYFEFLKD